MQYVLVSAPAKVNLALRVGAAREDGFHPLDTVFEAVDIFDDVEVTPSDSLEMSISGLGTDLPTDETNLVMQAARLLQRESGTNYGAHIAVTKRIPVAGGMAGGSADAAATLLALNTFWELSYTREQLHAFAAQLGSDVPFALRGGMAHGTSRGEVLEDLRTGMMHGWVILANPEGLSTPNVFAKFDELNPEAGEAASTAELRYYLGGDDLLSVGNLLRNDLQAAALALRPELKYYFDELGGVGAGVILCGSGASIALLCDIEQLHETTADIRAAFPELHVFSAIGPAAGAHLRQQF